MFAGVLHSSRQPEHACGQYGLSADCQSAAWGDPFFRYEHSPGLSFSLDNSATTLARSRRNFLG